MTNFVLFTIYCVILFILDEGVALRCRSANQEMDMQFQKVLQTCKKRYSGSGMDNDDSMSSESENSESDYSSEEKMFSTQMDRTSYNRSMNNNQRYRPSEGNSDIRSSDSRNRNFRDFQNMKNNRRINDQNSSRRNKNDEFNNEDTRYNNNSNNNNREQSCIVQCFFNELNVVDQKGFPRRDSVIPLMSQNIQDPELRDFVEESTIECFRYLESNKRDKCEFSQNLLKCLAEKGREKCEDWEN
ncbi:odorant-binding protein 59a [Hylaeus anthracinus]|uniref:odorant-binding protein 59a n=1 Tax=Hylaeus anthracinus TaxID=313031 RepID=UPI0023B8B165|nr:odorant-binding protein 59a [Hylaeus anthracinus]